MLRSVGLADFFGDALVIGAECSRAKPHPEPYLEGLRRIGVSPGDALAFEDSPSGLASAVAAGLATFGVTTTQAPETLLRGGAVGVVCDFRDAALWRALGEAPPPGVAAAAPA